MTENDVIAVIVIAAALVRLAQVIKADRDHKRTTRARATPKGPQ